MEKRILETYGSYENWTNYNVCRFLDASKSVDIGIYTFLTKLNRHGLHTIFSCSGHKEGDIPFVAFATYVTRDKIVKEMENIFGSCQYRLTEIVDKYGVKYLKMRIKPEDMDFYGIKYCKKVK